MTSAASDVSPAAVMLPIARIQAGVGGSLVAAREPEKAAEAVERAWGGVALAAKAAGIIERVRYASTSHGPSHACPKTEWRACTFGGEAHGNP
jgi:hypothetical protein